MNEDSNEPQTSGSEDQPASRTTLSPSPSPQQQREQQEGKAHSTKIDVLLKATADAPIMKKKKWAVEGDKQVGWVMDFIRKYLKLDHSDSLYLYVNQSFAPSPDVVIRNLYECFGSDGKLVLHYCRTQAWG